MKKKTKTGKQNERRTCWIYFRELFLCRKAEKTSEKNDRTVAERGIGVQIGTSMISSGGRSLGLFVLVRVLYEYHGPLQLQSILIILPGSDLTMSARITSREEYEKLLDGYDTWLFDCDGVLWRGDHLIDGVVEVLEGLRRRSEYVLILLEHTKGHRPLTSYL